MPKDKVRVVWVLQDPYPNPKLANGIAMSVPKGEDTPTLEAVRNELFNYISDITIDELFDETLQHWVDQGILLLNSSFTCRAFAPNSHREMWDYFIRAVLRELNKDSARVFIFSGKTAQKLSNEVSEDRNHIIHTYHPAADKHQREKKKKLFEGNDLFKQVDDILENINGPENKIQWLKQ